MTFKEIYNISVPLEKRKEEKYNIWVTIAVRPLSVLLTIPFVSMKVKPLYITFVSMVCSIIAFFFLSFGSNQQYKLIGWFLFFIWAVFDGVDGNLARCTNQCSQLGDLWDTTGGYLAMILMYFSSGIASYFDTNVYNFFETYILIILGGSTALFSIFPRLVMHKKKSYGNLDNSIKELSDKKEFGLKQIIAMNLVSPSGFLQIILLLAIIFHYLNVFIIFYFTINFLIMAVSLYKLLKE